MITKNNFKTIGFIGLGVMGEPICRNLARKSGPRVSRSTAIRHPCSGWVRDGVIAGGSVAAACEAHVVFLSLPSGEIVRDLGMRTRRILAMARAGSDRRGPRALLPWTSRVTLAREFAQRGARSSMLRLRARARPQRRARWPSWSVRMRVFERVLTAARRLCQRHHALCGPVGCGQVVKILNNMVLFETVVAISEAKAIGERAGVDPGLLFDALSKGSADSFALRNHGMKAVLPDEFPERAFSVEYARKDLAYALQLARETGVDARGARAVDGWLGEAIEAGEGKKYHPVISRLIGR